MKDNEKTIAFKDLRNSGGGAEIPFVAYGESQELSEENKAIARENIGAIDQTYVDEIVGDINAILDEINGEII